MNTNELQSAIRAAVSMQRPLMIWGAPGIGKSQCVHAVAEEFGEMIDFRGTTRDTVDVMGLPGVVDGHTIWNRPDCIPSEGSGILFLDELPQCAPAMQAALSQLILDRAVGPHKLGDGWSIIAAGNRQSDKCGTHRMLEHIKSRMIHVELDCDPDTWHGWAIDNGVAPEVIAYMRFSPDKLLDFDPSQNLRAYPCPRSWDGVSAIVQRTLGDDTSKGVTSAKDAEKGARTSYSGLEHEMIAGTVGEGAAASFMAYVRMARELPNPDAVLMNPSTAPVPEDLGAKYAIATALAVKATATNIDRVLTYVDRLDTEFSVMAVTDIVRRDKENDIQTCQSFTNWCVEHSDVLT